MRILMSACLLGQRCRYDGKSVTWEGIEAWLDKHTIIPFCPEQAGGLKTPRVPAERVGDKVITKEGEDVTKAYVLGAKEALRMATLYGCSCAILKAKSPSCGSGLIYDGTFTKTLVPGDGVTAAYLKEAGLCVYTEEEIGRIEEEIK